MRVMREVDSQPLLVGVREAELSAMWTFLGSVTDSGNID